MSDDSDLLSNLRAELNGAKETQKKILNYMTWTRNLVTREISKETNSLLKVFEYITEFYYRSSSQNYQDLIASYLFRDSTALFFCEIGACDGIHLSNSYLLEKELNWSGIVVEPNPFWHENLNTNRNCAIDFRPVWRSTGESLPFAFDENPELSTIFEFEGTDLHGSTRKAIEVVNLESISLTDLLVQKAAPRRINFLSIDTEGSEFEIIKGFDFSRFEIDLLVVEHNFTSNQLLLKALLEANGFTEILSPISLWDSWFVKTSVFDFDNYAFNL